MTTRCVRCGGAATTMACKRCTDRLRSLLAELPWWLDELETTVTGQARMGSSVRRTPRYRQALDGEAYPIAELPDDGSDNLPKARHEREQAVLRDALARGRVNARASELSEKVHAVLAMWVRDLCETRGIELPRFDRSTMLARWLHANVTVIAASEDFDLLFTEIAEIRRDIERVIDRPVSPRLLGPCPGDGSSTRPCGSALRSRPRDTEVTCEKCGAVHDIDELIADHLHNEGNYLVSQSNLLFLMAARGTPIPGRTFREWRRTKRIPEAFVSGEPRYRLADAVALVEAKPQTADTGARAAKRT